MRGIWADMFQKDCCALIVVSGSGMCKFGFTGVYAPRILFHGRYGPKEQLRGTFLSWRRGRFLWSRLFCGLSAVTVHCQVVDVLFVLVLQVPQVQFLEKLFDVCVQRQVLAVSLL